MQESSKISEGKNRFSSKKTLVLSLCVSLFINILLFGAVYVAEKHSHVFESALKRNLSWNSILDYNLSYVKSDEFNGALGSSAAAIRDNLQLFME